MIPLMLIIIIAGLLLLGVVLLISKIKPNPARDIIDQVIMDLIARPGTFSVSEYFLVDEKTKVKFRIKVKYYDKIGVMDPYVLPFSFWEGRRFRAAVDAWAAGCLVRNSKRYQPEDEIEKAEEGDRLTK